MLPKYHVFFGTIFAFFLLELFPQIGWTGFFIIVFSTIFIDFDHYLIYIIKKKNFNLKKAFQWHIKIRKKHQSLKSSQKSKYYYPTCIFHGLEILLIPLILSYFSIIFFFVFIGMSFHLLLDVIDIGLLRKANLLSLLFITYKLFNDKYTIPLDKNI